MLLRTTGLTLLMLTLCTMALLEEAANMAHDYHRRLRRPRRACTIAPLFGVFEFNPLYPNTQYLYVLGVLFVCFVFVRTLVYSPFGQSLTGIREKSLRMHAVGAPVRRRLVICYTISAAIAGIAGGLWAQANAYVNLSTLGLDRAATVLIILVLGGYGRLYGAFVGAVAYMVARALPRARSIRPPGSSGSACCWWSSRCSRATASSASGSVGAGSGRERAAMTALLETRSLARTSARCSPPATSTSGSKPARAMR